MTGRCPLQGARGAQPDAAGLKKINMDFGVANVDEDSTNDIVDGQEPLLEGGRRRVHEVLAGALPRCAATASSATASSSA